MADRSWWRVLTKRGLLEKGMADHFSILTLRTPWTAWKGIKICCSSCGRRVRHGWTTELTAYLTFMQITSYEMLGWMKHKLESRLHREISTTSDCRWYCFNGRKWRGTKEPLDESESGEWKTWFKTQHSVNEDHGLCSHHFMANSSGNSGNSEIIYFFGRLQNHCRRWPQPWN